MLRVTGPVTSRASACRGDATSRAPYRSASYTGPKAPPISISQPLQEPASTCLSCIEPARVAAAGGGVTSGRGGAGSATRPVRMILRHSPTSLLLLLRLDDLRGLAAAPAARSAGGFGRIAEVFEQLDLSAQHAGQDSARHCQQFGDIRGRR